MAEGLRMSGVCVCAHGIEIQAEHGTHDTGSYLGQVIIWNAEGLGTFSKCGSSSNTFIEFYETQWLPSFENPTLCNLDQYMSEGAFWWKPFLLKVIGGFLLWNAWFKPPRVW